MPEHSPATMAMRRASGDGRLWWWGLVAVLGAVAVVLFVVQWCVLMPGKRAEAVLGRRACDCDAALAGRLAVLEGGAGGCRNATQRAGVAAILEEMRAAADGACVCACGAAAGAVGGGG